MSQGLWGSSEIGELNSSPEIRECSMEEVTLRMSKIWQKRKRKFQAEEIASTKAYKWEWIGLIQKIEMSGGTGALEG